MTILVDTLGDTITKYMRALETLESEKSEIQAAMKETLNDAKRDGIDVKALKRLMKIRKMDRAAREEEELTLYDYMRAVGMKS